MRLVWRKQPSETGLARVTQGPRGFELRLGKEIVMRVAPLTDRTARYTILGWYWYGMGMNTVHKPCATAEEAKNQAKAAYQELIRIRERGKESV